MPEPLPPSAAELAKRLNTLLDIAAAERGGERPQFPEIRRGVEARGAHLSRQRWHYMRAGTGPLTSDSALLAALADMFGVPVAYLVDPDPDIPARIGAQIELLRTLREAEVKSFAARALTSDLSRETLLEIRDIIDQTLREHR